MSRLPLPVIELTSRPVGPDVVHASRNASRNAERIAFGGATLDVFIDSDPFELGRTALLDWITGSAKCRDGLLRPVPAHPSASET